MPIRRTATAALLAGSLALTACGVVRTARTRRRRQADRDLGEPVRHVRLRRGRPVRRVRGRRTPASRSGTSRRRARTSTGRPCRPGSRPGSGVADVQGIEVARIADVVTNQADLWTDLRDTPAKDAVGRYIDWKEKAATTPDGAVLGLGTDIGPMAHLLPHATCSRRPGLPTDRAQLAAQMPDLGRLPRPRREVQGRPRRPAPPGPTRRAGSTTRSSPASSRSTTTRRGNLVYATNPAVKPGVRHRRQGRAGGPDRQARAVRRPRLGPGLRHRHASPPIACPSWMIGYIKGKAGDAGAGKWDVTPLPGGAGGNWGGSYLGDPGGEPAQGGGREADHLADRARAAGQGVHEGRQLPVDHAGASAEVAGATDPYFNGAPIGQIFSAVGDRPRRCRSSARRTAS